MSTELDLVYSRELLNHIHRINVPRVIYSSPSDGETVSSFTAAAATQRPLVPSQGSLSELLPPDRGLLMSVP